MNMAHKRGKLSKLIKGVTKATAAILLTTTVMISCKSEKEKAGDGTQISAEKSVYS